jgi:polar amino acid transport system substrate-binding protein
MNNRKKIAAFLLAAVMGMTVLSGCVSVNKQASTDGAANAQDTSLEDVKAKGKFVVGLDATFAPMGFKDEKGEIQGFDIDLAKEVAKKMGVEVEFKPIDWDAKELELSSKKIDVIWNGFSISPARQKEVLFTNPYLSTKQAIVVKKDSAVKTKADLAGKKIALQDGSTSEEALKADAATYESIGDANISRFKENTQVLMEVDTGRVQAAVIDEVFVRYYLTKENMLNKYVVLEEGFDEEDYAAGGRLSDKALIDAISDAIAQCKQEGITARISEKWFGENLIK